MSGKLDFSKLELLTEEELNEEKGRCSLDDWLAYYTKPGVMTLEERHQYTLDLVYNKLDMKYGSNRQVFFDFRNFSENYQVKLLIITTF